jgi:hypothetical protein
VQTEAEVIRLPMVLSYALEEPETKAGKRKLDKEVATLVARISGSKKCGSKS